MYLRFQGKLQDLFGLADASCYLMRFPIAHKWNEMGGGAEKINSFHIVGHMYEKERQRVMKGLRTESHLPLSFFCILLS